MGEAIAFPLSQVRLADGTRWRANQQLDSAWMVSFPVRTLLHSFRTTAGVYSAPEGGYSGTQAIARLGGWESLDCDLRGHAVGHLLRAYALMYAATGSAVFKAKGDSVVAGLRECQQALGTGYVSAFPVGLLERNLRGQSVWAPWYTVHKLLAGLVAQYELAGNATALAICRDFTSWADTFLSDSNLARYTDAKAPTVAAVRTRALRNEFGGVGEAFYDIARLTADTRALRLARFFHDDVKMSPLYRHDFNMGTMHCNTFLPKVTAEARQSTAGLAMASEFWHEMVARHVLAPGCLSDKEHFFDPATTSRHLTGNTGETCCTYNMLRLTRVLYAAHPDDPAYFDYYERALVNHILGQQDPQTGQVHYFLPLLTGAYKLYSTRTRSMWCCVGSAFESHAKYGESIYWHSPQGDTLYVNLLIASRLTAPEYGLTAKLDTDYPAGTSVALDVDNARPLTVMLRLPQRGYKTYRFAPGHHRIAHTLRPKLHTEATPDDPTRQALFYGAVLLAGDLGAVGVQPFSDPDKHNDYYGYDYHVPEAAKHAHLDLRTLRRTGPLSWQTAEGISVRPLYDMHRCRYVVYWEK